MSIDKISSSNDVKDLISSCRTVSASLYKLLPVKLNGRTVMALVDSGNSFCNALSLSVAKRIQLLDYQPYTGSPVGTASVGSSINIVGIFPSINFYIHDDTGKEHVMPSRLVIVKHLSCGLNVSLPLLGRTRPRLNPFSRDPFEESKGYSVPFVSGILTMLVDASSTKSKKPLKLMSSPLATALQPSIARCVRLFLPELGN